MGLAGYQVIAYLSPKDPAMHFKPQRFLLFISVIYTLNAAAQNPDAYFRFKLRPGDRTGTVFMRTIGISGEGFSPLVSRVSGTGDYTVKQAAADSAAFTAVFRVDGHPASTLEVLISDQGRIIAFSGKRSPNYEGSGLAFNAFLRGKPPGALKAGDTWMVTLDHAWESGGPGLQKVTVIYADPQNHTVCLRREGDSEGFYEGESPELTINKAGQQVKVKIVPGKTHWTGQTIFRNGLVISDELIATRPLDLVAGETTYRAQQREYMMLNSTGVATAN